MKTLYRKSFEHDACGIGMIADIKGRKSNKILKDAILLLINLDHRGARGAEEDTGDGAGILMSIPHDFFKETLDFELPNPLEYGVGMFFTSHYEEERKEHFKVIEDEINAAGLGVIGFREVPINPECLGKSARDCMPLVYQVFVDKKAEPITEKEFERTLYITRKKIENKLRNGDLESNDFYMLSFSNRTIVYKGMLIPWQLDVFFPDLKSTKMETSVALVHSRFSTNTFPSWDRAHPNRMVIHNGEINTIKGNVKWIKSREKNAKSSHFSDEELKSILPVIDEDGSDSAMFDNTLEFLYMNGYDLAHAIMMMIPEPWENQPEMEKKKRAFYEYHSYLMEPWDGPAAMAFTDGSVIGASLDRNGLRPSRYYVTKDGLVILASEVGVIDVLEEDILEKQRLQPGKMLLIDTNKGRIISDEELKEEIVSRRPYGDWIKENTRDLDEMELEDTVRPTEKEELIRLQRIFGYTYEDYTKILKPMAQTGVESIGAMGNDAPLAVLSEKPQLLYNYFKQLFAQVTNPPIDAIREYLITGTETSLGSDGNLLDPDEKAAKRIRVHNLVLTNAEMVKIKNIKSPYFNTAVIEMKYKIKGRGRGLEKALEALFEKADREIENGNNLLVLSDRFVDKNEGPIPALLAVSALNQHLVRNGNRTKANIIVETGEARETHHFALLIGYGASCVNPYMAFENIKDMISTGMLDMPYDKARYNYTKAALKGIVKILSKMGISTIKSYRGSQIFECIGIKQEVVNRHFTDTVSRIEGIGMDQIAYDVQARHKMAFEKSVDMPLEAGGDYQYRDGEEYHMYNPKTIYTLQKATRNGDYGIYKEYANMLNKDPESKSTIRSLLEFETNKNPIDIKEVESIESIVKRFKTGAMSYGSISQEAHECMAIAMNRLGGKSNSGEGGESRERFETLENGDSKCSKIKQVASGRFGVNIEYLNKAVEIQIKMAQGAKPGEGGHLPGGKVYPWIANTRNSTPGVGLISPPPHHDIYSIEDLAQLIHDLKNANRDANICVKLVSEAGVGTVAAGVAKGKADLVLISGYDGGTGAAPRTSVRHSGLPWELGLAETHQTLVMNNLRGRIKVETDGKLMTGRDVVIAALLGAEEFGFATAPLVVIGCVMMRVCNLDTCPVGVATQNPELRKCFNGKPEYLENFFKFIANEMREYMAMLGFRTIDEMIGRTDKLRVKKEVKMHKKYADIDLSSVISKPDVPKHYATHCVTKQDHHLDESLDMKTLVPLCMKAVKDGKKFKASLDIRNVNRSVGIILASEVARNYGIEGMKEDTISIDFDGSAGQSFGAFLPKGVTFKLEGDANDYVAKGLSGGKIIIKQRENASYDATENILLGNVALYGAISGEAYFAGVGGERFMVRNSGAIGVCEGVGDHGCEYMTGGRAIILGETGRNFAAGMSGGIAYVYNEKDNFGQNVNREMVELSPLEDAEEIEFVKEHMKKHVEYTNSKRAKELLDDFENACKKFVKVIPTDYRIMNEAIERGVESGLELEEAKLQAFYEIKKA